jgi:hypothetical protein
VRHYKRNARYATPNELKRDLRNKWRSAIFVAPQHRKRQAVSEPLAPTSLIQQGEARRSRRQQFVPLCCVSDKVVFEISFTYCLSACHVVW